jgi:hypothetical protein
MTKAEGEKFENGENANPLTDEIIEVADDEIHYEDKGDDREAEEVRADMIRKNVAVEYSKSHRLKRPSPDTRQQE